MRIRIFGATAGLALALAAGAASATTFSGSYSTSYHTKDPGLVVDVSSASGTLNFDLSQGGSTTVDLFDLYTNESSVNVGEDTTPEPIQVAFTFTEPSPSFGGDVNGSTQGNSILYGFVQDGSVTWSNGGNQALSFGDGGELDVHLNDATFDTSFFGLHGGEKAGAEIQGTFTLAHASAVSAAPEPASWALMLGGVGILGGVLRVLHSFRRENEVSNSAA